MWRLGFANLRKDLGAACITLLVILSPVKAGENLTRVKNLEGQWKFSIGEDESWMQKNFNDESWEVINVPAAWEDQGFHGYNGYGTYRKSFTIAASMKGSSLYLLLGYIDDVDETYFNGHKIGATGSFPPSYYTAYNARRVYVIPEEYIEFEGTNTVAVKVYDSYQYGGIVSGDVGIFRNPYEVPLGINLQGKWKFRLGDELKRKSADYNDDSWPEIFVPGKWEDQGYRDYDGYAWYRKTFFYKGGMDDDKLVLMMGKIDDADEVYVNGIKVGSTGEFTNTENQRIDTGERFRALRGYYLDAGLLKENQWNTVAVRVYDSGGEGGVYEGPVGFLTQTNYIAFWRKLKNNTK
jgi:hypothetical protein